jgi:hypothetical protein
MEGEKISLDDLGKAKSVLGLGLVVNRGLRERGVITLFVNNKGDVEICPYEEVILDDMPFEQALDILLGRGYEDEQLFAYLEGRNSRESNYRGSRHA